MAIRSTVDRLVLRGFPAAGGDVPNFGRDDLARLFADLCFTAGAEVGVERGLYAEVLLKANPEMELLCVDPWRPIAGYREHVSAQKLREIRADAARRLGGLGAQLLEQPSVEAAREIRHSSLDFVYLDANHELAHVIEDIAAWLPKIRPGGILAGHDYVRRTGRGVQHHVVHAVQAWTSAYGVKPWWVLGRKERREGETRDQSRSWMWVVA